MLTFALAAAHRGRTLDPSARAVLDLGRPAEVPFEPARHLAWSECSGSVMVGGWQDASGLDAQDPGRYWHENDGDLTAFTGDPWPRGRPWRPGTPWSAQIADHLCAHPLASGTDELLGIFTIASLDRAGHGAVAADPFGMGHLYWGSNESMTVMSSRASLTARLLAVGTGRSPPRDVLGAGWLAFCECHQGEATPFTGVEVLAPGAHIEVDAHSGARFVRGRQRLWTFVEPPVETKAELFDEIRDDIASGIRRSLHEPVERRLAGLTGGRDSRTILAVMLQEGVAPSFEFWTQGPDDLPDVVVAERIASTFGLRHHRGSVHSGLEFRRSRAAAMRASGCREVLSGRPADRELAWRLQVGMGCGMRNVTQPLLGHPPQGDQVLISGYGGEGVRTNYAGAKWVRTRDDAEQFPFYGLKFGSACILKPEVQDHYVRAVHEMLLEDVEADDAPRDVVDAWYLRNRFRRFFGCDQELNSDNLVFPIYSPFGIRVANVIGPVQRWADRIPYEIIRRACPALAELPFQDGAWSELLTNPPAEPVTVAASAPDAPRPAETRTVRPPATPYVDDRGSAHRPVAARTVNAEQRLANAATDAEIMRRYLSDASNPLFEIVDQRTILERVEHFDRLTQVAQRQMYGALTAAMWLGGHELTFPISEEC